MIIAVAYDNGEINEHFGHAELFAIYETNADNTAVVSKRLVELKNPGHQGAADLMKENSVDVVICGMIGGAGRAALAEYGIVAFAGFCGDSDDAAELM
ncbi:MAG: hypothetical protein HUJ66_04030, partial [Oscillospiraceae bacterium]|nr:hypothetical protein [Oscillospiraceae bacterium]